MNLSSNSDGVKYWKKKLPSNLHENKDTNCVSIRLNVPLFPIFHDIYFASMFSSLKICFFHYIYFLATIEQEMLKIFSIPEDKEVRLWNRYMSNTFELLSKKDVTLQDAGLYQGQVTVYIF